MFVASGKKEIDPGFTEVYRLRGSNIGSEADHVDANNVNLLAYPYLFLIKRYGNITVGGG